MTTKFRMREQATYLPSLLPLADIGQVLQAVDWRFGEAASGVLPSCDQHTAASFFSPFLYSPA